MSSHIYGTILEERPDLFECLADKGDGGRFIGSATKVDWICPNCHNRVSKKAINKVVGRGISCPVCSDGVSRPEKITASLLVQAQVLFETQKTFPWAAKSRFDFFLPEFNAIIEVHGAQHYGPGFEKLSGFTYQNQVDTDRLKMEAANKNGISHYFVIKAETSTVSEILPQLCDYLNVLGISFIADQTKCEKDAMTSNVIKAADMWNNGKWTSEIKRELGVSAGTAIKYLKRANEAGLCNYSTTMAHQMSQRSAVKNRKRAVRCITTGVTFESLRDASDTYGITSPSNIIRNCNGYGKHAGSYDGIPLSWEYV